MRPTQGRTNIQYVQRMDEKMHTSLNLSKRLVQNMDEETHNISTPKLSRPKPDTRICDHDWHANIKPKPNINKNQLNFSQNFYKNFLLSFHSCFIT